jgi:hypothetical protein
MEKLGIGPSTSGVYTEAAPGTPSSGTGGTGGINTVTGARLLTPQVNLAASSGSSPKGDPGTDNLEGGLTTVTASNAPSLPIPASIFTGQPQAVEPVSTDPKDNGLIDVVAPRQPSLPIPVKGQGPTALDTLGFTGVEMPPETLPENDIVVSGAQPLSPYVPVTAPDIKASGTLGLSGVDVAPDPLDYEGIDVAASKAQPLSPYVPVPGLTGSRANMGFTGARDGATPPEEGGTTLRDIADYLRLAGIGTSLLGGLVGGGGGGGGQRFNIPSTMGRLSPVFGGSLPSANIPGLSGTAGAARSPSELAGQGLRSPIDYYRYGYGPEQSFYSYVPQGAPNTSQAYTGYAEGGYAVEGPGDGRDDQIPALLSDGEYVIDAETVALLGNGSNKAGAEMLDAFRVNVRKQKGQKLARGEFSENAKRPEHYMAGGLS